MTDPARPARPNSLGDAGVKSLEPVGDALTLELCEGPRGEDIEWDRPYDEERLRLWSTRHVVLLIFCCRCLLLAEEPSVSDDLRNEVLRYMAEKMETVVIKDCLPILQRYSPASDGLMEEFLDAVFGALLEAFNQTTLIGVRIMLAKKIGLTYDSLCGGLHTLLPPGLSVCPSLTCLKQDENRA